MIELQPSEFPTVAPLFEGIDHNVALVYALLERNSPGRVFVDRQDRPSSAFLYLQDTFYYIGGNATNDDFNQALIKLIFDDLLPNANDKELVLFAFSDPWRTKLDELLGPRGAIRIQRQVFAFNKKTFRANATCLECVPRGFRLVPIDARLAETDPRYKPLIDPASKRFGVCLLDGNEIVSTCRAVCVGRGEVEIDIHTAGKYRRQGYGTLTACAFIQESMARGLIPNWACWPERIASRALAKKLGFEDRPSVPAHYWAEGM